ncbi:WG repeat-containing protein [Pedobacter cryophilus]|uniref:WG repeat-containing protein n=1 Tax=Pedobacter cryophilus TaxID=2571271 RepID=A0A4U1C7Y0_9SPHI|nr:WG repeat-containing protein [Pedobacter cryophilus]TKC00784.1 WG repeat-containing protein [Pedobacter cryophilus]
MKNLSVKRFFIALISISTITVQQINAQYVPAYDKNGVRTSSDKAAEEARNKQNKPFVTPKSSPSTTEAATTRRYVAPASSSQLKELADAKRRLVVYELGFLGELNGNLRMVQSRFNYNWGYLNSDDDIVLSLAYDGLKFSTPSYFGVKKFGYWGFVDQAGKVVISIKYDDLNSEVNGGIAMVTRMGKKIFVDIAGTEFGREYNDIHQFSEGLASVKTGKLWGFIDKSGKMVIPAKYDSADAFGNGLAPVKMKGKSGYINASGKLVIPLIYDDASVFYNGLAKVILNGKSGFIDPNGKVVIALKYDRVSFFKDGLALVSQKGKVGYINTLGYAVIPLLYDDYKAESNGYFAMKKGKYWGFLDKNGAILIDFQFDEIVTSFNIPAPNYPGKIPEDGHTLLRLRSPIALVNKDHEQFTIDARGKMVGSSKIISPTGYDKFTPFINEVAAVSLNGKWGMINKKGDVIIPIEYESEPYEASGLVKVKLSNKFGFLDKTGKIVIPIKYDEADLFSDNFARVKTNGKWGVIDKTGKAVLEMKYDEIKFELAHIDDRFLAQLNGKWSVLDKSGKEIFENKYDNIERTPTGFLVQLNSKWGLIDKTGKEIVEIKYDEKCQEADFFIIGLNDVETRSWAIKKYGNKIFQIIRERPKSPEIGMIYFLLDNKFYLFDYNGKKLKLN